ncbi:MAG: diacylglycerol kinase family lipid kinase [Clostridiales Family XIII bacterium]|jgi:YegS/Rv2252/BmrU family lipid kinase|nr:diacylglycerol kinase family lipid kinase [Clostridiales Family XIII bacterium]
MRHIFLINPVAGNGRAVAFIPQIIDTIKQMNVAYEIHRTINIGDACRYARERCQQCDEPVRFYACGGDGTVNEVVNGIFGHPHAEIAIIPVGSGNDFVRNFENKKDFLNIEKQILGEAHAVDTIEYRPFVDETKSHENLPQAGYALNMCNMGFDAQVAAKAGEIKGKFLKGAGAYIASVGIILSKLKYLSLEVTVDGVDMPEATYLLAGAANGRFSGGGFDGMPLARISDGIMDVLLVRAVTRRFFLSIVKKYHDGTHLEDPRLDGILEHIRCKEATIRSKEEMLLVIDGEPLKVQGVHFILHPSSIKLSVPNTSEVSKEIGCAPAKE